MNNNAIAVFTGQSKDEILRNGGSQAWVLNKKNAMRAAYAVLYYNQHAEWSKSKIDHGKAFIVGKISSVAKSKDYPDRSIILFDEFAEVDKTYTWGGWRNPVKYATLEELEIDVEMLTFKPMPEVSSSIEPITANRNTPLTIEAAKIGLALTFGVKPEAIEINIRG